MPISSNIPSAIARYIEQQDWRNTISPTSSSTTSPTSGLSLRDIPFNERRPGMTFAAITDREQQRLEQLYYPVENEVVRSLNDTSIVDAAREDATRGFDNLEARNNRSLRRYGVQLTPVQQREMQRTAGLGRALTYDEAVNTAELAQRTRNDGLRRELINIGRGVASQAQSSFAEATSLQRQREANNDAISAQNRAAAVSTVGNLASTAIMAYAFQ